MAITLRARPRTGLDVDFERNLRRAIQRWELVADELPRLDPGRREQVLREVADEAEHLAEALVASGQEGGGPQDAQAMRVAARRLRHVASAGELHVSLPRRVVVQGATTLRRHLRQAR